MPQVAGEKKVTSCADEIRYQTFQEAMSKLIHGVLEKRILTLFGSNYIINLEKNDSCVKYKRQPKYGYGYGIWLPYL